MAYGFANVRKYIRAMGEIARDLAYAASVPAWTRKWPKFDIAHTDEAAHFFDQRGWVIFRNVFERSEIENFRHKVALPASATHEGDLLTHPSLGGRRFVFNDRIIRIARSILGGVPCYFGDSTVSVDVGAMGFHKDNPDREDADAPDWQSRYSIIRMGLYLQDHAWHSGGLAVRDQSHLTIDTRKGRPLALPTEQGDVAVWSLRTTHSGYATRPRMAPNMFVPIPVVKQLGLANHGKAARFSGLFRPLQFEERIALFATFGLEDRHLDRYLAYLQTRQYAVQNWQATHYSDQILADAADQGVKLISMHDQVSNLDLQSLNKTHAQFVSQSGHAEAEQVSR